ncbi:hypothetical protein HELRODRAFT_158628 [Helobdella robusta]|uniref:Uncharacterized protein n=1 Tax=Helobdella robusta TaxID=6412 RepID=T1EN14_HELRO|nr:hypothetical protein HELRODRAFT_158628 [Helobdella robusta]ESO12164.1 hypothetical protein HELRODRAFT_158628 [Helobdella robusta]
MDKLVTRSAFGKGTAENLGMLLTCPPLERIGSYINNAEAGFESREETQKDTHRQTERGEQLRGRGGYSTGVRSGIFRRLHTDDRTTKMSFLAQKKSQKLVNVKLKEKKKGDKKKHDINKSMMITKSPNKMENDLEK